MKEFFKDYIELQRESNKWLQKHWKGYLVLMVICMTPSLVLYLKERHDMKKLEVSTEE